MVHLKMDKIDIGYIRGNINDWDNHHTRIFNQIYTHRDSYELFKTYMGYVQQIVWRMMCKNSLESIR